MLTQMFSQSFKLPNQRLASQEVENRLYAFHDARNYDVGGMSRGMGMVFAYDVLNKPRDYEFMARIWTSLFLRLGVIDYRIPSLTLVSLLFFVCYPSSLFSDSMFFCFISTHF